MRTTVDLPDDLLVHAKRVAADRHVPLTRLLEESLRLYLSEKRPQMQEGPVPLPVLADPTPVAGVDLDDTSRLWELDVDDGPGLRTVPGPPLAQSHRLS